ncbi:MAG TPA: hypothetical protein VOB72_22160 [Candidatus Dormibacteraeota bacterium]|nr:hypothetical protein [Candidatus Dormibacteraeota bacterium]
MAETRNGNADYIKRFSKRLGEFGEQFVKTWKTQAKRPDTVGEVSYRGLELVHGGLGVAARSLTRLEKATLPPHRTEKLEPHVAEPPAKRPRAVPAHAEPTHHGAPKRHGTEPTSVGG